MSTDARLRITEIFYSLQGETSLVGLPTVFIRLTGCPLRCTYCDTEYAFHGGEWMDLDAIIISVKKYTTKYITLSGGEPLAQPNCINLLNLLCDEGYTVSLETSGALSVADVDPRVIKIIDVKTPGSSEESKNLMSNVDYLNVHDELKFVICDRNDYEWAKQFCEKYNLYYNNNILFSPSYQQLAASDLANWILADQLTVRLQIQLHKYLWGEAPGK